MIDNTMITKSLLKHLAGEVLSEDYRAEIPVKSIAGSALKCFGDKGVPKIEIRDIAKQILASYTNAPNYQYNKNEAILAYGVSNFETYIKD